MKHQIVHTLQKYFLNPPIKIALAVGLPLPGYAILETKGRKTGKPRRTPVGDGRIGNQFWLVADQSQQSTPQVNTGNSAAENAAADIGTTCTQPMLKRTLADVVYRPLVAEGFAA